MASRCWIVELTAPELIELLPAEHRELATCIEGAGGERLLVYRDNLTAYKAASLTDGRVRRGCLVAQGDGGVPFEDGRRLLVEPLAPDGLLRA